MYDICCMFTYSHECIDSLKACYNCIYYGSPKCLYLSQLRQLLEIEHFENINKLENDREKCYNDTIKDRDNVAPNQSYQSR